MKQKIMFNVLKTAGDTASHSAGSTLFKRGDPGDSMFAIIEGEIDIVVDGKVFDTLGKGEILGEMSLIDKQPRSADAVARTDCVVMPIDERRFLYMTQNTPMFALQVLRMVSARLRERMADLERLRAE